MIELTVGELRRLLTAAERDLTEFLALAAAWAIRQLPRHADPVTSALARALALTAQGPPSASSRRPGVVA
ncbi:hypothetical protein [Streptomyces sp. YIM B13508]|uniref:hypothetical protein n=1 Tax=Streptomyces sp. YIM B13508 TaxID=3366315 RepID=UPI0036922739